MLMKKFLYYYSFLRFPFALHLRCDGMIDARLKLKVFVSLIYKLLFIYN